MVRNGIRPGIYSAAPSFTNQLTVFHCPVAHNLNQLSSLLFWNVSVKTIHVGLPDACSSARSWPSAPVATGMAQTECYRHDTDDTAHHDLGSADAVALVSGGSSCRAFIEVRISLLVVARSDAGHTL